jgi:hypothetical protein
MAAPKAPSCARGGKSSRTSLFWLYALLFDTEGRIYYLKSNLQVPVMETKNRYQPDQVFTSSIIQTRCAIEPLPGVPFRHSGAM